EEARTLPLADANMVSTRACDRRSPGMGRAHPGGRLSRLVPHSGGRMRKVAPLGLALVLLLPAVLRAQEPVEPVGADSISTLELPDQVADSVVAVFNDPLRLRLIGTATVSAGDTIVGSVSVLEGPLTLAGRITGDVLVVNGDLQLEQGASVGGNVTVVGGRVGGLENATISGAVTTYAERLRYRRSNGDLVRAERPR